MKHLLSLLAVLFAGASLWAQSSSIHIQDGNAYVKFEDTSNGGDIYTMLNNTSGTDVLNFAVWNSTDQRAELSFDGTGNLIKLNGKFGIGTQTPSDLLDVNGTARFRSLSLNNGLDNVIVADGNGKLYKRDASTFGGGVPFGLKREVTCIGREGIWALGPLLLNNRSI